MVYDESGVEYVIKRIAYAVSNGRYRIAINENRKKNAVFLEMYRELMPETENILMSLTTKDYVQTVQNRKIGFEDERLHIFGPKVPLTKFSEDLEEDIVIYIKVNIIEKAINDFVIVVSFHEAEHSMNYPFK